MWVRIWRARLSQPEAHDTLEWARAFLDGSVVPAKKGKRLRADEVRKGLQVMIVADGQGMPIGLQVVSAHPR
jgi:hypothetical protein